MCTLLSGRRDVLALCVLGLLSVPAWGQPCTVNLDCTGLNTACTVGVCNLLSGMCEAQAANEGGVCNDGDLCTTGDVCTLGVCGGTAVDCTGLNDACNVGVCNALDGTCQAQAINEGGVCSDGDLCTTGDVCTLGVCAGTAVDCTGLNDACNVGVCNALDGLCQAQAANEGGVCDDGLLCTSGDTCTGGSCIGTVIPGCLKCATAADCNDGNPCTDDTCPAGTCVFTNNILPCDDGNACTTADTCGSGVCGGTAVDCTGLNDQCNVGVCNTLDGTCQAQPANEGGVCSDGNLCTTGDVCTLGVCGGTAVDCTGLDNACNVGVCNVLDGTCQAQPANEGGVCSDGMACTAADTCVAGSCVGTVIPGCLPCVIAADCNDNNPCTDDTCPAGACVNTPNDANNPDDGFFCNGTDTCVGGIIVPGTAPTCDDLNPCTTDLCDELNDTCQNINNAAGCDDGNDCTGNDVCAAGVCSGTPIAGCQGCVVAADCDDLDACTSDSCVNLTCVHVDTTPPGACCSPATGVITPIDDNDLCTIDTCNPDGTVTHVDTTPPGQCCSPVTGALTPIDDNNGCTTDTCLPNGSVSHTNNTLPCDDGDLCTANDTCTFGFCVGVVNDPLCTPTLDLVQSGPPVPEGPGPACIGNGEIFTVRIEKGPSTPSITGGQFFLEYDPATVQILNVEPGGAPFVEQVFEIVDPVNGTIDYAVGVLPTHPGTTGPATMAIITVQTIAECDTFLRYRPHNPPTLLTDNNGIPRDPVLSDLPPLRIDLTAPVLTCPGNITVNADAGGVTALVNWTPVIATDSCDGDVPVTCSSSPFTGLGSGGVFPPGVTTIDCSATNSCGVVGTCTFDVDVLPFSAMHVDIELSPAIAGGPLTRCITFEFHRCGVAQATLRQEIEFGGPFTFPGLAENVLILAPAGPWQCVTARDELHTLRSTAPDFTDDGTTFSASFVGSPTLGGHWLVSGNLNDIVNNTFIDISDFAIWSANFGISFADTNCSVPFPHADINGDGIVTAADFSFIQANFLDGAEPNCCGLPEAEGRPRTRISVRELNDMGMGDLSAADYNGDGMVDVQDMILAAEQMDVPVAPRLRQLVDDSSERPADSVPTVDR